MLSETGHKIFDQFSESFTESINLSIQKLLNSKHLYQSVEVIFPDKEYLYKLLMPGIKVYSKAPSSDDRNIFNRFYDLAIKAPWQIVDRNWEIGSPYTGIQNCLANFSISPLRIRSHCKVCKNDEPYNFVRGFEILNENIEDDFRAQVFSLAFECQGCKGVPEVFLVRREGNKLTLSGRSPIEQVIVPSYLPKEQSKYISDAIVANNSGQTLSGIFQLRTFIEQYVRSISSDPKTENIELLFTEYSSTLPKDFKDRFPSLKTIYESLSVAIHLADPNDDTYLNAKEEIDHHFEAKKTFRI